MTWLQPAVVSMFAINLALCEDVVSDLEALSLGPTDLSSEVESICVQWALGSYPSCPVARMGSSV